MISILLCTNLCFGLCLGPSAALVQDKPGAQAQAGGTEEASARILELFHAVERRLMEIDAMLFQASAGERALPSDVNSGIQKLLDQTREQSKAAREQMDEILKIAQENSQSKSSSSSGSGQPKSPGQGAPQQGQKPGDQTGKEQTPKAPGPGEQQGEKPGDKPQAGQEEPGGRDPKNPTDSKDPGSNRSGNEPPTDATGSKGAAAGADRWGDLPVHVRDLFRMQGGTDLPPRYRDWIDAYYKSLNQKR